MVDASTKGVDGDLDILQFSAPIYFVEKDEGMLQIDIMRLGHLKGELRVQWYTLDGSAKAGWLYEAAAGEAVLEDGESDTSIQIAIIKSTLWAPTLEFKVRLERPEYCVLGKYLHTCRVKVIDKDVFPSSKYQKLIGSGDEGIAQISGPGLLWEYFKLNFMMPGMKRRSILTLVMCQLQNVYLFFTVYITIYLVDDFFATQSNAGSIRIDKFLFGMNVRDLEWDERQTALWTGVGYAAPMLLVHLFEYWEARLDVLGRSRGLLQASLFRKYLNYSEESRSQVLTSDMQIAILHDAHDVAKSYVSLLHLSRMLVKLLVMGYFVARATPGVVIAMYGLMLLFGHFRNAVLTRANDCVNNQLSSMGMLVADTCQRYRLVADYARRPQVNDRFQQMVEEYQAVDVPAEVVKLNNIMCPRWLGPVAIGVFIAVDAPKVFSGHITMGNFLAVIGILQLISTDFETVYNDILEISKTIALLKGFTKFFNLQTDLGLWKNINRQRREQTMEARAEVFSGLSRSQSQMNLGDDGDETAFRSDTIPFRAMDMSFQLGSLGFEGVNLSAQQGRIIAVVGPHGSGKATFLKLLAHNLFPSKGVIFIPTHLRILQVTQEPLMMNISLWKNLNFGVQDANDIDPARVHTILENLQMSKTLQLIQADMHAHPALVERADEVNYWQDELTYTEKVKVHIARAFIMNPEVMVLQRPLHHFEATAAELILSMLKKHVAERGLAMPPGNAKRHRRPRTVFFSPETVAQARQADVIWQISKVSVAKSTVHITLPQELEDGFERSLGASPMSLMNPTVALQLNDGQRRSNSKSDTTKSSYRALSDQIINLV